MDNTSTIESNPPFEGVSAAPKPLTVRDDRTLATLAHFGGVLGCLPSGLIYATMRHRGRFTAQESREALNFTLLPTVVILVAVALSPLPVVGGVFGTVAAFVWVYLAVMSLVAGMKVNKGNPYQYRLSTRGFDRIAGRRRARTTD